MKNIQAIRGMNDLLPEQSPLWQYVEAEIADVLASYGYNEIRTPILEQTELFKRSIGEVTDIVEKEMYTFDDRNGDSLTLRPEGTASTVRAAEQAGILSAGRGRGSIPQRLWYCGPMFRHEKPQKGRLRQFHQFGIEAFGMPGAEVDAEVILVSNAIWQVLGVSEAVTLELNSIGSSEDRAKFGKDLYDYLVGHKESLDEDSQRRLDSNPLRILDSKDEGTQKILEGAPKLVDYINEEDQIHFAKVREVLDRAGVSYRINPSLVRGLDYYGKTVFEWVTDKLGSQGTVCAGGRYDGLVAQLGGDATPGVGFGLGIERLVLLLETLELVPDWVYQQVDLYVCAEAQYVADAMILAEQLRSELALRVRVHANGGGMKSQTKAAQKTNAPLVVFMQERDMVDGKLMIRSYDGELVEGQDQLNVTVDGLIDFLTEGQ